MSASKETTFTQKVMIAVAILFLFGIVVYVISYAINFFFLIFGGILFGVLLRAATNVLSRVLPTPKGVNLFLVLLIFIGIIVGATAIIAPTVEDQISEIQQQLPDALENLEQQIMQFEWGARAVRELRQSYSDILPDEGAAFTGAMGIIGTTLDVLIDVFIVFIIGIFFASNPHLYKNGIVKLLPVKYRERVAEVIYITYKTLAFWLVGKFIAMLFVAVLIGIGLWILGVPLVFGLSVIAFFLDFIPTVGPIVAAVPAVLLAFLVSPFTALMVAILYLVVQQLESYLLMPIIFEKTVHISPVMTIASLVFFGILAGPIGVILAVPLYAAIKVIIDELYVKDYLERGRETG